MLADSKDRNHSPYSPSPQVVKGTNFDMGYQQGRVNKYPIIHWLRLLALDESIGTLKHLKWPIKLSSPLVRLVLGNYWKHYLRRYLPGFLERIEGIAEGADCSPNEIFLQQAFELIGAFPLRTSGCSSVMISAQMMESKEPAYAKNFDYMPFLKRFQIVRESYPEQGYASIELTVTPLVGSHAGMNECGLIILYHYAYSRDVKQHGLPLSFLVQHLLQTCSTIEELLEEVGRIPWLASGILIVGDARNRFALVELSNSHVGRFWLTEPWMVVTNHFLNPDMKQYSISPDATFLPILPPPWKGTRIRENSEMRYRDLETFLKKHKTVTLNDVKKILSDHGSALEGSNNTVCRHSKISSTICSAIFFPSTLRLLYCHGAPCSGTHEEYQLHKT